MRFVSINKLSDFEFHDAKFILDTFNNNLLRVKVKYLNIHKNTEQNAHETDMEIADALITFKGFHLLSYEPSREWKQDENGELYWIEPQIVLDDASAFSSFLKQLESGITIFDLGIKEGNTYFIDALTNGPFFVVCFTFGSVKIEWDEYVREAWYTSKK